MKQLTFYCTRTGESQSMVVCNECANAYEASQFGTTMTIIKADRDLTCEDCGEIEGEENGTARTG